MDCNQLYTEDCFCHHWFMCLSSCFFKPRSTLPCLNSASLWPRAQWHAPGYSTMMCCCAEGSAVWFVYSPERAFQSLFQPSNSLCLSLPCSVSPSPSPSLSLSLSPFHPPPPLLSLSLGIMMCRDICVLDCCLSWTVRLQRARQR